MCVTLPLTVVFVALDNLVFLLYPHRPTQEGFEAFLRTILKFTGKSLLLVLAGAFLVIWAPDCSGNGLKNALRRDNGDGLLWWTKHRHCDAGSGLSEMRYQSLRPV